MFDPPHPGEMIGQDYRIPLGVTRKTVSELLNGHSGVSPEMAIRLQKAGWTTAAHWLRMQMEPDLWHARLHATGLTVTRLAALPVIV